MGMIAEFKQFAFKGNVVDLAVGVVIGAAFGKIVAAVVGDLVMPIVSLALPRGNSWREAGITLREGIQPFDAALNHKPDDVILRYGDLVGTILDFLIVALVLFLIVSKIVKNAEKRFSKPVDATTKECPFCLEVLPIKASRCKACTSQLAEAAAAAR